MKVCGVQAAKGPPGQRLRNQRFRWLVIYYPYTIGYNRYADNCAMCSLLGVW